MNSKTPQVVLEITEDGDVECLYTDEIDLYAIGRVENVRRASDVVFDETTQEWVVKSHATGEEVHRSKHRDDAIAWEIANFGPGGQYFGERSR